jgi:hypothetical protein
VAVASKSARLSSYSVTHAQEATLVLLIASYWQCCCRAGSAAVFFFTLLLHCPNSHQCYGSGSGWPEFALFTPPPHGGNPPRAAIPPPLALLTPPLARSTPPFRYPAVPTVECSNSPRNPTGGTFGTCSNPTALQGTCDGSCSDGYTGSLTATCTAANTWTINDNCAAVPSKSGRLSSKQHHAGWERRQMYHIGMIPAVLCRVALWINASQMCIASRSASSSHKLPWQ